MLEFGRYGNSLEAYMLVANYLTRRIHHHYVEKMEKSLGDKSMEPPQLLITIEEATQILRPQVARQTTFGIIAREMRKYNVTLLVVDQRPSAIDEEVMSQIGTRVTALLDNERDIARCAERHQWRGGSAGSAGASGNQTAGDYHGSCSADAGGYQAAHVQRRLLQSGDGR